MIDLLYLLAYLNCILHDDPVALANNSDDCFEPKNAICLSIVINKDIPKFITYDCVTPLPQTAQYEGVAQSNPNQNIVFSVVKISLLALRVREPTCNTCDTCIQ